MGKLQLIFDTDLDWHTTLEKAKELLPHTAHQTHKGLILVDIENPKAVVLISRKGKVNITCEVDYEDFCSFLAIVIDRYKYVPIEEFLDEANVFEKLQIKTILETIFPFCLTKDGEPCEWRFQKINPLPSFEKEAFNDWREKNAEPDPYDEPELYREYMDIKTTIGFAEAARRFDKALEDDEYFEELSEYGEKHQKPFPMDYWTWLKKNKPKEYHDFFSVRAFDDEQQEIAWCKEKITEVLCGCCRDEDFVKWFYTRLKPHETEDDLLPDVREYFRKKRNELR